MAEESLYLLKKKIELLQDKRGRHTELISVYIPDGYDLNKTISRLGLEQGTAENIKSKGTRKNVTTALEKIISELRLFKKTPEHGLAIFCGNVSKIPGKDEFLLETIIPPKPLSANLYRCSQTFVLEPLKEMFETGEIYGLIVIDRQEAAIALLKGKTTELLVKLESIVPGKFRAGGQSAQRFERVTEGLLHDFFKEVAEKANAEFLKIPKLKGIIVGGPGPTKQDFLAANLLHHELVKKVLGQIDIGYTGESGIEELVNKSQGLLKEAAITREKQLVTKFLEQLGKGTGLAVNDLEKIKKAFEIGAVDVLLVSEKIRDENLIAGLKKLAEQTGASFEFISQETMEGQQLAHLGGVAAILRFKIS